MVEHGGSSSGSHLADPTSPIPSHCASIVATSTLRVKGPSMSGFTDSNFYFSRYYQVCLYSLTITWYQIYWIWQSFSLRSSALKMCRNNRHQRVQHNTDLPSMLLFWEVLLNSYSASHGNWCTATLWNRIMTAQCEGMGEVGSARYKPALLPPCPSIRVLSYSNYQEIHPRQQTGLAV